MKHPMLCDTSKLIGRVLMSLLFIFAGWNKIGGYEMTEAFLVSMGIPGLVLPLVIVVELVGGLAVLLGLFTRIAAFILFLFCFAAAGLVHLSPGDAVEMTSFMKNITIAGGFLILACAGAGRFSLDHWIRDK
ncbi:DoxX family protein [Microbulbifer sp. OS29]|uniref:DoxX family protein n=1 Tax=Microbulbifer okhotskensis TaxID=2926617 RepID=A0A9X2J5S2_9GAMM|nr:DoxX family membrane protein [Microbulbifer okhotskensis]MCO1335847.1 DoxX family protein [Microbulbifer okhotskensis]